MAEQREQARREQGDDEQQTSDPPGEEVSDHKGEQGPVPEHVTAGQRAQSRDLLMYSQNKPPHGKNIAWNRRQCKTSISCPNPGLSVGFIAEPERGCKRPPGVDHQPRADKHGNGHLDQVGLHIGAGEGNRTPTISLGSTPIGAVMLRDLRRCLSASSRI